MATEVVNKEVTTPPVSLAERLMARKAFTLSQPSVDRHTSTIAERGEAPMSNAAHGGTKGFAGLMMFKRRVGNWKKHNTTKAGSAVGSSSIRSGMRLTLENTYQLTPSDAEKFDQNKVRKAAEDSLRLFLIKQSAYNAAKSAQISRYISDDIKSRVKALGFKRYKIVVNTVVGQAKEQDMEYASRCLWNTDTDSCVTVVRQHKDMYVVVNIFGVYFE